MQEPMTLLDFFHNRSTCKAAKMQCSDARNPWQCLTASTQMGWKTECVKADRDLALLDSKFIRLPLVGVQRSVETP